MNIAAVVIWFNPSLDFLDNIKSYSKHVQKIIIVDNSDIDNSILLEGVPDIDYIPCLKNIGVASALNVGYERALASGAEWVLSMDQDSWFDELEIRNFLDPNASHFKEGGVAIFAPSFDEKKNESVDCNSVISSGSLVKLSAHQSILGYNDSLFIDQVDHEYCYRLKGQGYRIIKLNWIYMHHTIGDPISKYFWGVRISSYNHNAIRRYYITRNVLYMRKYYAGDGGQHLKGLVIDIVKIIILEPDKILKLLYMARGVNDYIFNRMGPLRASNWWPRIILR